MSNRVMTGLVVIIFAVLGIALLRSCSNDNTNIENEAKIQAEYSRREMVWQDSLSKSEVRRRNILRRYDSLSVRFDSLDRLHSGIVDELNKISGKFDKLNSSELRKQMIDNYNARTQDR